jgi:hypothetical protein
MSIFPCAPRESAQPSQAASTSTSTSTAHSVFNFVTSRRKAIGFALRHRGNAQLAWRVGVAHGWHQHSVVDELLRDSRIACRRENQCASVLVRHDRANPAGGSVDTTGRIIPAVDLHVFAPVRQCHILASDVSLDAALCRRCSWQVQGANAVRFPRNEIDGDSLYSSGTERPFLSNEE